MSLRDDETAAKGVRVLINGPSVPGTLPEGCNSFYPQRSRGVSQIDLSSVPNRFEIRRMLDEAAMPNVVDCFHRKVHSNDTCYSLLSLLVF